MTTMFMVPFVSERQDWFSATDAEGRTFFFPSIATNAEEVRSWIGEGGSVATITGYGARFSAPGYLDATEWVVFDCEGAAAASLRDELFCDCDAEDCGECGAWLELDTLAHSSTCETGRDTFHACYRG